METAKELFAILIAVGFAVLFIRMLVTNIITAIKNRSSYESLPAVLKKKAEESGVSELGKNGLRHGKKVCLAIFETKDGDREFMVSEDELKNNAEGISGTLYCRRGTFLSFTPDSLARSITDEKN